MIEHLSEAVTRHPDLEEYYRAMVGDGQHAGDWKDKPHRLIYDLIWLVVRAREKPDYARGM